MPFIYKIRNIINNKLYIGKAEDVHVRWQKHLSDARTNRGYVLHNAIRKYGKDNFEISIIEKCDNDEQAVIREVFWIAELKTNCSKPENIFGYNLTDGGEGIAGHIHTAESRQKMSDALKGKPLSEAHKLALSIGGKGKILSEAHKSAIRIAGIGKIRTKESKIRYSESKLGNKNPQAILDDQKVIEIKALFVEGLLSNKEIADRYGVASKTIRDIKNNITWKHVLI